jgi:hypothetical protein
LKEEIDKIKHIWFNKIMEIKCKDCQKLVTLTEEQENNVKEFAEKGMPFMVFRCPLCHNQQILHPLELMGITTKLPAIEDNRLFYCPSSCCIGYIEYDKENKIYTCVECGSRWKNKNEIFNSISETIKKYKHRKLVYKKIKNGWKSIPIGTAPDEYYTKLQNDEKIE